MSEIPIIGQNRRQPKEIRIRRSDGTWLSCRVPKEVNLTIVKRAFKALNDRKPDDMPPLTQSEAEFMADIVGAYKDNDKAKARHAELAELLKSAELPDPSNFHGRPSFLDESYRLLDLQQTRLHGPEKCQMYPDTLPESGTLRPCASCCHCHTDAQDIEVALEQLWDAKVQDLRSGGGTEDAGVAGAPESSDVAGTPVGESKPGMDDGARASAATACPGMGPQPSSVTAHTPRHAGSTPAPSATCPPASRAPADA